MYWPRAGISAYPSLPSTAPPITRFLLFAGRFRPRTRKRPAEPGAPLDSFNERTNTTYMASASAHPGGGVHGGPGSNAARAAIARQRVRAFALAGAGATAGAIGTRRALRR